MSSLGGGGCYDGQDPVTATTSDRSSTPVQRAYASIRLFYLLRGRFFSFLIIDRLPAFSQLGPFCTQNVNLYLILASFPTAIAVVRSVGGGGGGDSAQAGPRRFLNFKFLPRLSRCYLTLTWITTASASAQSTHHASRYSAVPPIDGFQGTT